MLSRLLLCVTLLLPVAAQAAPPEVVVSIKPLHSLVAAVMDGVGQPTLLVPASASPHSYALAPSQAKTLARATLVVWVGPAVEGFLEKPLAALGARADILAMADIPGVTRLPTREGGPWEAHHHGHDDHDDHDELYDGHLWLDIGNARALVAAAAAALTKQDPRNAEVYARNAARTTQRLDRLDAEMRQRLAPVAGIPFLVFHDAFQYVEARYGLTAVGAVTVDADRAPGAKRVAEIRARVRDGQVRCLFSEPQFNPRVAATIAEDTRLKLGTLDDLGAAIPQGPDAYFTLWQNLAADLNSCLWGGAGAR